MGKDFFVDTSARVKVLEKLARPEEEDWKKRAQQEVELSKPKAFAVSSDAVIIQASLTMLGRTS